jgi:hypothetical protein
MLIFPVIWGIIEEKEMSKEKVVLLGSPSSSEESVAIKVDEDGTQETGIIRFVKEGRPIHGEEIMTLSNTPHPLIYDVIDKVSLKSKGPAKVSSPKYRENYDRIFDLASKSLPN